MSLQTNWIIGVQREIQTGCQGRVAGKCHDRAASKGKSKSGPDLQGERCLRQVDQKKSKLVGVIQQYGRIGRNRHGGGQSYY